MQTSEDKQVLHMQQTTLLNTLTAAGCNLHSQQLIMILVFSPPQEISNEFCFHSRNDGSNQDSLFSSYLYVRAYPYPPRSWQLHAQTAEMTRAGLDSSLLNPFLSEPDLDHPDALPPIDGVYFNSHSDEYFDQFVTALELDCPLYTEVDPSLMDQFNAFLSQYSEAFHLPDTSLGTIKGFYHNIDTGDSTPVYQLPYRKVPLNCVLLK